MLRVAVHTARPSRLSRDDNLEEALRRSQYTNGYDDVSMQTFSGHAAPAVNQLYGNRLLLQPRLIDRNGLVEDRY